VYGDFAHPEHRCNYAAENEVMKMSERQKRVDDGTAKAVARGLNILAVRNRSLAQNYMEYKRVPTGVIARVLDYAAVRRMPSTEQLSSEAITPSRSS
jgi:hypothetical protein